MTKITRASLEFIIEKFSKFELGSLTKPFSILLGWEWTINPWLQEIGGDLNKPTFLTFGTPFLENGQIPFNTKVGVHNAPPFALGVYLSGLQFWARIDWEIHRRFFFEPTLDRHPKNANLKVNSLSKQVVEVAYIVPIYFLPTIFCGIQK